MPAVGWGEPANPNINLGCGTHVGLRCAHPIHGRPRLPSAQLMVAKEEEIAAIHSDFGSCLTPVSLMEFADRLLYQPIALATNC